MTNMMVLFLVRNTRHEKSLHHGQCGVSKAPPMTYGRRTWKADDYRFRGGVDQEAGPRHRGIALDALDFQLWPDVDDAMAWMEVS
jgi:hypothetical protein